MNAVNLIPLERRRGEAPSLPGIPFIGLVAALVIALGATFVYVGARNQVATRSSELSHVQAGTAAWSASAARYAPAIATLKQQAKGFVQLGALLGERANWSLLLGQIAGVMPARAQLTSLSATTSGSASASASSTTSTTPATGSGITVSGCAATQPVVADTMIALRRLSGVSAVSLSSSTRNQAGGSSGATSACTLPVQFNLTLQFTPPTDLARLLAGTQASGTTTSTTARAVSASDSTGAAQ